MLKRGFDRREAVRVIMDSKGKLVAESSHPELMSDTGHLTEISLHLNNLNLRLHGRDKFFHNV
jgi:hypothetical protein